MERVNRKRISDLKIGDFAEKTDFITLQKAMQYAMVTEDNNPIHFETAEAYQSRYGKPIAHGMILAGFISGVIGMFLPGNGCIYETQTLTFRLPVFYEEKILTRVTVSAIDQKRNRVTLRTECFNQQQELVLTGEVVVLPSR